MKLTAFSKKWLLTGTMAALVFAVPLIGGDAASFVKPVPAFAADAQTSVDKHTITVNGSGEMTVTPDVVYASVGIQSKGATAKEAQAANAEAFAKLNKVLYEDYKLDKADVKTANFNVYPEYNYTDKEQKLTGYVATQMLQVTLRDLDKLGTFLDDVSAAGANMIQGVQFSTEKSQDYELQVIDKAMANAESKAKAIAKYAGKDLKGIVNVVQSGSSGTPIRYADVNVSAKSAAIEAAGTSVAPGELKVTTNVTVTYEF